MADLAQLKIEMHGDKDVKRKLLGIQAEAKKTEEAVSKVGGTKKATDSLKKQTSATQKAKQSSEKLHKTLSLLNKEYDRLGTLSRGQTQQLLKGINKLNKALYASRDAISSTDYSKLAKGIDDLQNRVKGSIKGFNDQARATEKAANAQTKLNERLTELRNTTKSLEKLKIRGLTSGQISKYQNEVSRLNKSLLDLHRAGKINNKEYTALSSSLDRTSTKLKDVKKDADFAYNSFKKFWERFGKVGLGFSAIYGAIQGISAGMQQLGMMFKEGIQQAGEMVDTQAKLAMWFSMASDEAISYSEAFQQARVNTEALADASVRSISSLSELATGLDELGQAGVIIGEELIPQFANLVDFTTLVAQTTGSTTRQVRQELQALMQGQMRTTNILIRTAKHLGILTEEQIAGLKQQEGRLEAIKAIMEGIGEVWEETKRQMIIADVNTGFKMWYDTLVRIISKSEELASKDEGVLSIFGETAYEHFDKMQAKLDDLSDEGLDKFLKVLNAVFDEFLTKAEKSIFALGDLGEALWSLRGPTKNLYDAVSGLLKGLIGVAGQVTRNILNSINTINRTLESLFSTIGFSSGTLATEGIIMALLFGPTYGILLTALSKTHREIEKVDGVLGDIYDLSLKAGATGLIGMILFGKMGGKALGFTIGSIVSLVETDIRAFKAMSEGLLSLDEYIKKSLNFSLDNYLDNLEELSGKEKQVFVLTKSIQEQQEQVDRLKKSYEEANDVITKLAERGQPTDYMEDVARKRGEEVEEAIAKLSELEDKLASIKRGEYFTSPFARSGPQDGTEGLKTLSKETKEYIKTTSNLVKSLDQQRIALGKTEEFQEALNRAVEAGKDPLLVYEDLLGKSEAYMIAYGMAVEKNIPIESEYFQDILKATQALVQRKNALEANKKAQEEAIKSFEEYAERYQSFRDRLQERNVGPKGEDPALAGLDEQNKRIQEKVKELDNSYAEMTFSQRELTNRRYSQKMGNMVTSDWFVAQDDSTQQKLIDKMNRNWDAALEQTRETFNYMEVFSEKTAENMQENFSDLFFDAFTGELDSAEDYFNSFARSMLRTWADVEAKMLAKNLFGENMGALTGKGGGGWVGTAINWIGTNIFHDGGTVGRDTVPQQPMPVSMFNNAPRLHDGLASDEYPAILQRGETVIPRGEGKSDSPNVQVNVINNTNQEAQAEQQQPKWDGEKWVLNVVLDAVNRNKNNFGKGLKGALSKA